MADVTGNGRLPWIVVGVLATIALGLTRLSCTYADARADASAATASLVRDVEGTKARVTRVEKQFEKVETLIHEQQKDLGAVKVGVARIEALLEKNGR